MHMLNGTYHVSGNPVVVYNGETRLSLGESIQKSIRIYDINAGGTDEVESYVLFAGLLEGIDRNSTYEFMRLMVDRTRVCREWISANFHHLKETTDTFLIEYIPELFRNAYISNLIDGELLDGSQQRGKNHLRNIAIMRMVKKL